jgi:hypothetical protein
MRYNDRSVTSMWHFTNSQFPAKQINFKLPRYEHYTITVAGFILLNA